MLLTCCKTEMSENEQEKDSFVSDVKDRLHCTQTKRMLENFLIKSQHPLKESVKDEQAFLGWRGCYLQVSPKFWIAAQTTILKDNIEALERVCDLFLVLN